MQKKIALSVFLSLCIVGVLLYFLMYDSDPKNASTDTTTNISSSENVTIENGMQYIVITAKNGYTPKKTIAQANMPTTLIVKTNGTVDRSASLVIKKRSFHKILTPTGEESIDIGTFAQNEKLQGACSMGMYHFTIEFK